LFNQLTASVLFTIPGKLVGELVLTPFVRFVRGRLHTHTRTSATHMHIMLSLHTIHSSSIHTPYLFAGPEFALLKCGFDIAHLVAFPVDLCALDVAVVVDGTLFETLFEIAQICVP
jgi:hypothetical protein